MKNKISYYLKKARTPFFVLSMVLSIIGSYQIYHGQYRSVLKEITVIIISVMKLFTFFPTNGLTNEAPLAYELAIWMAPLSTMVGIFSIFERLYRSLRMSLIHLNRKHLVIMGGNEDSLTFIRNVKSTDPSLRIYCLLDQSDSFQEDRLASLDVETIRLDYANPLNEINFLKIKDKEVGDLGTIISFEDEPQSFGRITALDAMYEDLDKIIDLYVKNDNYRIKELVEDRLDQVRTFNIHFFNIDELMVLDLMTSGDFSFNPPRGDLKEAQTPGVLPYESMEDLAQDMGTYNILIIGFSPIAEHFLNLASNILTINPLANLSVTIIDSKAKEKFQAYNDYKTLIAEVMDVSLIDLDAARNLADIVKDKQKVKAYHACLFAEEDLRDNILNVDRTIDILVDVPIAIYSKDLNASRTLVDSLRLRHDKISLFGDENQVLTMDIIVNQSLYKKAKDFNAYYNLVTDQMMDWPSSDKSVEDQWLDLNNIKKESSIYQSAHQDSKLKVLQTLVDYYDLADSVDDLVKSWQDKIQDLPVEDQVDLIEADPLMNYMTALEHKRWNNFYYMRDFTYSPVKDEKLKTHNCLIDDWEDFMASDQRDKAIYDFISSLSLKKD